MKTMCPGCALEFEARPIKRSVDGICAGCGCQLPELWRWKRCEDCNADIRRYVRRYRENKRLKAQQSTKSQISEDQVNAPIL